LGEPIDRSRGDTAMPIHEWTRVQAGVFHDFHQTWIAEIKRALNQGLLPADHYALVEQIADGRMPSSPGGVVALTNTPPRVWFRAKTEVDRYAAKAKAVVIRHSSNHRVIAVVEVMSPGNKSSRQALGAFVEKAVQLLRAGIHLLVVDLFPPSPRDPQGIHKAIWDEFIDNDFTLPAEKPLTLAAYIGGPMPETFVEPAAVGLALPNDMPLFLTPDLYVPVPLERTYQSAWEAVPAFWQNVLAGAAAG
jgi:hypothetical protein